MLRAFMAFVEFPSPPRPLSNVLVCGFLCALLAPAPRAAAYALEGERWPPGSVVTFQLGLGPAGRTLIDGNTSWDIAAAPAASPWNDVVARLGFQTVPGAHPPVSSGDGVNAIVFSANVFGQSFGNGTLAVTYYRSSGSTMVEADVLFNKNYQFDSYRGELRYPPSGYAIGDIRRVLIHELGHALGLDHPDDHGQHVDAIMNSRISNRETLAPDDIAGAQYLYGAAASGGATVTPADTPISDFDGNGSPDLLLYNGSARQAKISYLNNSTVLGSSPGTTLPNGWRVVGAADFNRNGQVDFLLFNASTRQSAIWYLKDGNYVAGVYGPTIAAGYLPVTTGDLNRDGHPDLVIYNPTTRRSAVWFMNDNNLIGGAYGPTLPTGWRVVGAADFNGDGSPDYLLFNSGTRQTAIWYLSGTTVIGAAYGPTVVSGYVLLGAADFNRDRKPDYLLYKPSAQQTAIWHLNNNSFLGGVYGPTLSSGWNFAGP